MLKPEVAPEGRIQSVLVECSTQEDDLIPVTTLTGILCLTGAWTMVCAMCLVCRGEECSAQRIIEV